MKRKVILAICALVLGGCAGEGTQDAKEINNNIQKADGTTAFLSRNTGFTGSAVPIYVLLDGQRVATAGNNEVVSFKAPPGKYTLTVEWGGVSGFVNEINTLTYTNGPNDVQYFTISFKDQLFGARTIISEVTASSFVASR